MRIIRGDQRWSNIRPRYWLEHMTPPSKGLRGDEFEPLLAELRDNRPIDTIESHAPMPVILAPGKDIGRHQHPEWTLVYFIDAAEVPIIVEGICIYPANNTSILLEPGTRHEVARNQTLRPRLSLALRFKDV